MYFSEELEVWDGREGSALLSAAANGSRIESLIGSYSISKAFFGCKKGEKHGCCVFALILGWKKIEENKKTESTRRDETALE